MTALTRFRSVGRDDAVVLDPQRAGAARVDPVEDEGHRSAEGDADRRLEELGPSRVEVHKVGLAEAQADAAVDVGDVGVCGRAERK